MKSIALLAAFVALGGCATVIRGAKDTVKFESEPPGASVSAESISADKIGPIECTAPCKLELKRKREWKVDFALDGYKPVSGVLTPKVTGGGVASGLGNVVAGGIIGIGVDAGTGANLDLKPNPMIAKLAPVDSADDSVVLSKSDKKTEPEKAEPEKTATEQ